MTVFLGGTCADSKWRDEIIPMLESLKINYKNPVVKNWTKDCKDQELRWRKECDIVLYVCTKSQSVYSFCEAVDDSNKRPDSMIFALYPEIIKGKVSIDDRTLRRLDEVGKMIVRNGGTYVKSLEEVIEVLKQRKEQKEQKNL